MTTTPSVEAYLDPSAPVSTRVNDLLARMTLAEKVGQMLQLDARGDLDHLVTAMGAGSLLHASPERILEANSLVDDTRLRIPLLMADDCIHGHSFWPGATILPTQLAMASTWDPRLVQEGARITAVEVAATGLHWTFSPVLCIARDPRWGRVGETFGEDPHLIGELGAAMIRGYQGDGLLDPNAVLATAKHFAGYSETQGGRDASEADLSPRKLRSWFLPPFQRAVEAGCRTFMIGYQAIDGVPITANRWLLSDVLKDEWGFTGTLVTDWDNVGRMVWEQQVCADHVEAAIVAVEAGNDFVMTTPEFFDSAQEAVRTGRLDESRIDAAVSRILTLKFELGLFDGSRVPDPSRRAVIGDEAHTAVSLELSRRALVLLRNSGVLPLTAAMGVAPTIVIIGPNADDPHAQLGDWAGASGQVPWLPDGHPRELITTVLDGFREFSPASWRITSERGADIGHEIDDPAGAVLRDGQPRPQIFVPAEPDQEQIRAAVAAAEAADWAVVVLGDKVALTGENKSTATLELQGGQVALLDALVETDTPVIVVLIQSKPSVLPPSAEKAAAIIEAFNPGMQGGRAIAELITGAIEPTGRLPISFPRHAGQLPVYYNGVRGQHGDRYADLTQQPLFAFGEGLSYTTVAYDDLRIIDPTVGADGLVRASVRLSNTGSRPVTETVQAYVKDTITSATWADRELKAFVQVELGPGETTHVRIDIPAASCSIVNARAVRVVEHGEFELFVGHSSRDEDLLSATFTITDGEAGL